MSRLISTFYDLLLMQTERRCLRSWRTALLADVSGEVLEIGAGTGLTLFCYPGSVSRLTLAEPDPHMRRQLAKASAKLTVPVNIIDAPGEALRLADDQFDAVVLSLVLCSVKDPQQVLCESLRLLKPGGRLYFMEHVAAARDSQRFRWQQRIEPLWRRLSGNCHLTRRTEEMILDSGFFIEHIIRQEMCPAPFFVRPTIRGCARKRI